MAQTEIYRPNPQSSIAPAQQQPQVVETAGMVLASQAKALVEARYIVALRQPRDLDVVRAEVLRACKHPTFADEAIYHKPIGEGIEGPSIRLVEALLQSMGNISTEVAAIYDDLDKRIVRVTVSDNQKNASHSGDVTVRKAVERNYVKDGDEVVSSRTNSKGKTTFLKRATDDEILNTQNALVSKALRTLGLRLVPAYITREALDACRATLENKAAADPAGQKKKLFDAFGEIGIPVVELKAYLGHDRDVLTPPEILELRGVFAAIRDGETTWDAVMDNLASKTAAPKVQPDTTKPTGLVDPVIEVLKRSQEVAAAAAQPAYKLSPATGHTTVSVPSATISPPPPVPVPLPSTPPGAVIQAPAAGSPAPAPRGRASRPESIKDRLERIQASLGLDAPKKG